MQSLRKAMEDDRVWSASAIVSQPDDPTEDHYRLTEREKTPKIEVFCRGKRTHAPFWALLRGGDRDGSGVQTIPSIGTEVVVNFDDGESEGDAYIVGTVGKALTTDPSIVLLIGPNVEVRSSDGTASGLSFITETVSVDNKYAPHIHLDATGNPTGGPIATVVANDPNPSFPSPDSVHPFMENGVPTTHPFREGDQLETLDLPGTQVIKGE